MDCRYCIGVDIQVVFCLIPSPTVAVFYVVPFSDSSESSRIASA